MKSAVKLLIVPIILMLSTPALARIKWNEPQVIKVKLKRRDRRLIRFSGTTTPNSLVRIRNNKIKLYLDDGKKRWVAIPQKDRVQFPLTSDGQGGFEFRLLLPTTAVEIPVQVKTRKKWTSHSLNYRVSGKNQMTDFKQMEDSFRATDEEISKIDRKDNYYSRKNDKGLLIQSRDGKQGYDDSTIEAWGGLGFSYFDVAVTTASSGSSFESSDSTTVIPTFRFGADWAFSQNLLLKGAIRSTSGSTEDIAGGGASVTGNDFNWLEAQAGAVWFGNFMKMKKGRLGLDFGIQLQQLPFFRQRQGFINFAYFDNNTWNLHVGAYYQVKGNVDWDYDIYARYLYTLSTGDAFEMNTSFPLMFEFGGGVKKRLTQGLSFGVYGQLEYFSTDVKYSNNGNNFEVDLNLMLLTVDARLIANF